MIYEGRLDHLGRGLIRFVHRWQSPRSDPWAQLVIVHGLGDHGGRFARMARWLVSHGINVFAWDLVGHGRSPGRRGCTPSYDFLLLEIDQALQFCDRHWPHLPKFAFGQSMGGNLVLNWGLRRRAPVTGVVAGAPMLRPGTPPSPRFLATGLTLARWFPNFRLRAPVKVDRLCRDPAGQRGYLEDQLVHRWMSLRLGLSLVQSGQWALENAAALRKPTLLLHGARDVLTCPQATIEFADRSGDWSTLRIYPGLLHDLHYEPEWMAVLDDLRRWLADQALGAQEHRAAA